MVKEFLIDNNGIYYLPNEPDIIMLTTGSRKLEITDIPFGNGKNFDQLKYVSRPAAMYVIEHYPDIYHIEKLEI